MAVDLIRYVNPAATGAADGTSPANGYLSLVACVVAEEQDLQAADIRLIIEVLTEGANPEDTGGTPALSSVWNSNFSTGHYVLIRPYTGHEAGTAWDATKYRLATATNSPQSIFRDIVVDNIQIDFTYQAGSQTLFNFRAGGSDHREIKRCYLRYSGAGGSSNAVVAFGGDCDARFSNNIFDGFPDNCFTQSRNAGTYLWSDNTYVNCGGGIIQTGTAHPIAKGNIFSNVTTPCSGTFAAGTDYNSTDNASIGYTVTGGGNVNDRLSQTFTFVSATDFALQVSDTGAYQQGVDLSGDATYPITLDILGGVRGTTTSIGAHDPDAVQPPQLSNPVATGTGTTTASGSVDSNGAGHDIWAYISQSSTKPSAADLKAGTGADATGFIDSSVSGTNNFSGFTGLTGATTYYMHCISNDGVNDSDIVTSSSFTTETPLSITSINSGNPVLEGQVGVLIQWNGDATLTTNTKWNGGLMANHMVNVGGDPTVTSFDAIWSSNPGSRYGVSLTASVDDTYSSSFIMLPPSGWDFINVNGYEPGLQGSVQAIPDVEDNDQAVFETLDNSGNTTYLTSQLFAFWDLLVDDPLTADSFDYYIIDADDGTQSNQATIMPGGFGGSGQLIAGSATLSGSAQSLSNVSGSGQLIAGSATLSGSAGVSGVANTQVNTSLVDSSGNAIANTLLDWLVFDDWGQAPAAFGSVTTDNLGNITVATPNAAVGPAWMAVRRPDNNDIAAIFPVTVELGS